MSLQRLKPVSADELALDNGALESEIESGSAKLTLNNIYKDEHDEQPVESRGAI